MHQLRAAVILLRRELASLAPDTFAADQAAALVKELAAVENACGVAKARLARRAAECGAHRSLGYADASDWLAGTTGTTVPDARRQIEVVTAVEDCPETRDALVNGEVSLAQAQEIVRTETAVPGTEAELLDLARGASLGALRDRARTRRVDAIDAEQLHCEQRARRSVRHWRDELGMVCGQFRLTPEIGVPFVKRLDAETDRLRRAARRDGPGETRAAYVADAFASMVAGSGRGRSVSADLVLVCDINAYRRGHRHPGELSHIVGGGPIPPSIVRELSRDAFLKVAFHDGVEIHRVLHVGRRVPAELRTALELGAPPEFDGVSCSELGCDRRYGLEWDHVDPVANGGATSRENLRALCGPHHWDKTQRDRTAGLLSGHAQRGPP